MVKEIKIIDIEVHPGSKAVMVYYEFNFKELGKKKASMTLWPRATKEEVRYQLKHAYKDERELRQKEEEDLSSLINEEIDVV